nr:hypothetical protein CFP56_13425 [Quercus suber]
MTLPVNQAMHVSCYANNGQRVFNDSSPNVRRVRSQIVLRFGWLTLVSPRVALYDLGSILICNFWSSVSAKVGTMEEAAPVWPMRRVCSKWPYFSKTEVSLRLTFKRPATVWTFGMPNYGLAIQEAMMQNVRNVHRGSVPRWKFVVDRTLELHQLVINGEARV